jgi:RHS repeat-associated protein
MTPASPTNPTPRAASGATMSRRGLGALVLAVLGVLWADPLLAQTAQVVEYYHTDALGSVRAVTKAGVVVSRHDFLPFGEELQPQIPPTEKRLFAGNERDTETASDHFWARQYAPRGGRFTSPDPGPSARLYDPQSWNRYSYVSNRPLSFLDPLGPGRLALSCSSRLRRTVR